MERTNEEILDLFADLIDPCSEIMGDKELATLIKNGEPKAKIASMAIRNHKKSIITILAMIDGKDPNEYKINMFLLPIKVISFLNSPEVEELFPSQGQKKSGPSSGSATENITVVEN